jgi:hypothetical protein
MANDPHNLGLSELGQRVQAMSEPVAEPSLRPYQGSSTPATPPSSERPITERVSNERLTGERTVPATANPSAYRSWTTDYLQTPYSQTPAPAAAEQYSEQPYSEPTSPPSTGNGYSSPYPPLGSAPYSSSSSSGSASSSSQTNAAPGNPPLSQLPPLDPNAPKSGLQRAIEAVRSALPLVQRLLPLLEGNVATAISTMMVSQPTHHAPPPPPVKIDLEPVERGLAEVRTSHRELRTQVTEQSTSIKRVEDQLDRVREATDRNTLEQQELVEDLRAVGGRISTFAIIGLVLLALSFGLNVYFLVQLQHILR